MRGGGGRRGEKRYPGWERGRKRWGKRESEREGRKGGEGERLILMPQKRTQVVSKCCFSVLWT